MVGNVPTYPDPKEMFCLFLVQFSLQRKEKKLQAKDLSTTTPKSQENCSSVIRAYARVAAATFFFFKIFAHIKMHKSELLQEGGLENDSKNIFLPETNPLFLGQAQLSSCLL